MDNVGTIVGIRRADRLKNEVVGNVYTVMSRNYKKYVNESILSISRW